MKNELCGALDKIQADSAMKARTADFLRTEINKRAGRRGRINGLAAVCAVFLLLVSAGGLSYNVFFTSAAYIDVDVNPSIGLSLNRFNRVINAHAFNEYGAAVLGESNTRFKAYSEAMQILLDTIIAGGYLTDSGLVSVSVQSRRTETESDFLESLSQVITASLAEHHRTAQADIFTVTDDVRMTAHRHRVTPARYLAIRELQAVDPTITFEECRHHSIGEIRERARGHGGGCRHYDGDGGGNRHRGNNRR